MTDRRSPAWRLLFLLISTLALGALVLAAACGDDDDGGGDDDDGATPTETGMDNGDGDGDGNGDEPTATPDDGDGNGDSCDRKVTICHNPPGKPTRAHTIEVAERALPAHLAHGESPGPCVTRPH